MSIHVALSHITHYRYDRLVKLGPQVVRLRPAPHSRTQVLSYSLSIAPEKHFINWQQDPFANWQARLVFPEPTRAFKVTVDLVVEMAVFNPFDFFLEPTAEKFPFEYSETQARELAPYLAPARCPAGSTWSHSASTASLCGTVTFNPAKPAARSPRTATVRSAGATASGTYAPSIRCRSSQ